MKKFYAILLALALTLGFSATASAIDYSVSAQFVMDAVYDINAATWTTPFGWDSARFEITFKVTSGPVSAEARVRATGALAWRYAWATYKLSDQFSFGVYYDGGNGTDFYASLVDGSGFDYNDIDGDMAFQAMFNSGDFSATVATPAALLPPLDFYAKYEYDMDPVVFSGVFALENADMKFIPGITYQVTDEWAIMGEVWFGDLATGGFVPDISDYDDLAGDVAFGIGTEYEAGIWSLYGGFFYNYTTNLLLQYFGGVEVEVIADYLSIYADYVSADFYAPLGIGHTGIFDIGFDWNLDGAAAKSVINVEYVYDDGAQEVDVTFTQKF